MSQGSHIGFALFGLGRAGMIHANNLIRNPQARLKYIVDIDENKAKEFVTSNLLDTKVVPPSDVQTVLSDPSVHASVITTPTHLHEELVVSSLKAGKAVLCEKPVAITMEAIGLYFRLVSDEKVWFAREQRLFHLLTSHLFCGSFSERCYADAESRNIPLLCAFNRRFDPTIASVANRVRKGDIGKVHIIKTTSRDSHPPTTEYIKISGGIFHDSCIHDVDMICWIMGETPHTVYCMAHAFNSEIGALNDVDTVGVIMKFPSGAIGQIDLSRHAVYGYDQRVEVFGADGMLSSDNVSAFSSHFFSSRGCSEPPLKDSFPQRYAESYVLEMQHLINAIKKKEILIVSKEDVLRSWHIAEAIERSFHSGNPVTLNP